MSIESNSVSNPVVRENENSSRPAVWSGTQGSATGSKDGQFGSFWDKALTGAQKLLGIETSSRERIDDSDQSDKEEKARSDRQWDRLESKSFEATPGFGSSGFGRLSLSLRRDRLPPLPAAAERLQTPEVSRESLAPVDRQADFQTPKTADRSDLEDSTEEEDAPRTASLQEAKTAPPLEVRRAASVNTVLKSNSEESLAVGNQKVADSINANGINSAKHGVTMSPQTTVDISESAASDKQSLSGIAGDTPAGGIRRLSESGLGTKGGPAENAPKTLSEALEAQRAISDRSKSEAKGESRSTNGNSEAESLLVDPSKAKRALSTAVEAARSAGAAKGGSVPNAPQGELAQPGLTAPKGEVASTGSENSGSGEGGLKRAENGEARAASSKSSSGSSNSVDGSKGAPANSPSAAVARAAESTPTQRVDPHSILEASRSVRQSDARPVVSPLRNAGQAGPLSAQTTAATSGVSGAQGSTGVSPQNKDTASVKQTFEATVKSELVNKATATSSKGDGTMGVHSNSPGSTGSSKSVFAAKSQPMSYATKTAEETKEVFTALTKSVDRLVSTKGETVSVRINFDTGGTLALRVSMESGQVNASMQTDVHGLESAIKSSWSEFANEMNQKGVKVNTPQFGGSDSDSTRNEHSANLDDRAGQSKDGKPGDAKADRRGSRDTSPSSRSEQDGPASREDDGESSSDQELQTYA